MNVVFHPEFPRDQRKFEADYGEISPALAGRFREEIDGGHCRDQGRTEWGGAFPSHGFARGAGVSPPQPTRVSLFRALGLDGRYLDLRRHHPNPIGSADVVDAFSRFLSFKRRRA